MNLSSNEQYNVKRPFDHQEKAEEVEISEKKVFFNSKMDSNQDTHLKELDTKEDLFLNKFIKVTSSNSIAFSSSNENSLQNMPFINKKKEEREKIEINYEDMELENRDDLDIKEENNENGNPEVKKEIKKMIIIQRKDNIEIEKQTPNKKEEDKEKKTESEEKKEDEVKEEEEEEEEDDEKEEKEVKEEKEKEKKEDVVDEKKEEDKEEKREEIEEKIENKNENEEEKDTKDKNEEENNEEEEKKDDIEIIDDNYDKNYYYKNDYNNYLIL